ncbi:zinc-binding dehydrogenase [Algoriphagus namhaensis]
MQAIRLNRDLAPKIELTHGEIPDLKEDEVLVKIEAAALNHRDEWARKGLYPNLRDGVILGSDGAGRVVKLGKKVDLGLLDKEVIINPAMNWGESQSAQGKDFEILGIPTDGTLAEYVAVPAHRVYDKPTFMTWEEAASLPLAGLTAYRALFFRGVLTKGQKVLVTGFGGGVAQFAAQFALAAGGVVSVSSSSAAKRQRALDLGASHAYDYRNESWVEKAKKDQEGFDLIIDGAAGKSFGDLLKVCAPGATLVFYGATTGNPEGLDARRIFWNQLAIKGSTMGSDQDFEDMLHFVTQHQIRPLVDQVFTFDRAVEAFDRMRDGKQLGKIILKP